MTYNQCYNDDQKMKTLMMTAQECVAVELGYNWVSIELTLVQINWICPTIYPDI